MNFWSGIRASFSRCFESRNPYEIGAPDTDGRRSYEQGPFILACTFARMIGYLIATYVTTLLLAPEEFGRLLLIGVPVALVNLFGDFGLSDGLVRLKEIRRGTISLFFFINLGCAVLGGVILIATIPFFEWWNNGARLDDLAWAFAGMLVMQAMVMQYRGMLRRQMRLDQISGFEVAAAYVGNGSMIILAFQGWGALAIPLGRIAALILELCLVLYATRWLPGRMESWRRNLHVLQFGGNLAMAGVFRFGGAAIAAFVLGRHFPPEMLGYLERATSLTRTVADRFAPLVKRLTFSTLARARHLTGDVYAIKSEWALAFSVRIWIWPLAVGSASLAAIIPIALGPTWTDLAPMLLAMGLSLVLWLPEMVGRSVILAHGSSNVIRRNNMLGFIGQVLVIPVAFVWGLVPYLVMFAIVLIVKSMIFLHQVARISEIDFKGKQCFLQTVLAVSVATMIGWQFTLLGGLIMPIIVGSGVVVLVVAILLRTRKSMQEIWFSDSSVDAGPNPEVRQA